MAQAERLSESNDDLEQFPYFAYHDLQEPLRMFAIYTELLEQNFTSSFGEELHGYLQRVRESVRRLEILVADLLTYSRALHEEPAEYETEVDSQEALLVATTNLQSKIERSGAEIISSDLPRLSSNPVQLIQIFQNLIGNSLKYRGAEPPRITVAVSRSLDEWIFSVRDTTESVSAPAITKRSSFRLSGFMGNIQAAASGSPSAVEL